MAMLETVKMEIGYEDDGTIIFVEMDKVVRPTETCDLFERKEE